MEIKTLVQDIYALVERKDGWFDGQIQDFGQEVARRMEVHFGPKKVVGKLRLSKMGDCCPKQLWHSVHTPELAEPLPPWAEIKYSYGHILEALAITLAKASGHTVEGEQDELVVDGIVGHRDCVIDGCIVDVKSSSSFGFNKFKDKSLAQNDSFGYLDQLDGYLLGSSDDPVVRDKERAYILAIDKQLGHMCLYEHRLRREVDGIPSITKRIEEYKRIVGRDTPPPCTCKTKPEGKSGNIGLDIRASYSPFKYCCFPNLRVFLYADGPKYLTHVERMPDVPEINREGQIIYQSYR